MILATHQIQYAIECDKIGILDGGKLIGYGDFEAIKPHLGLISKELIEQSEAPKKNQS